MAGSKPQGKPISWFVTTRKGQMTLFVNVVALLFAVAVIVNILRGKLALELGFGFLSVSVFAWFGIAHKAIDAIAKEDAAEKGSGSS